MKKLTKMKYGNRQFLGERIRSILLEEDPGGVFIKELLNDDEYDVEIEKIIQLLKEHTLEVEFIEELTTYFLKMFGDTGKIVKYKETAKKIWFISKKEDQVKLL